MKSLFAMLYIYIYCVCIKMTITDIKSIQFTLEYGVGRKGIHPQECASHTTFLCNR